VKKSVAFLIYLLTLQAQAAEEIGWPDLKEIQHVARRPATEADIKNGAAVFLLQSQGASSGLPLDIVIPQYALHRDEENGKMTPVIVIQAEESNGKKVIGAYEFKTRKYVVGLLNEFKLLGNKNP